MKEVLCYESSHGGAPYEYGQPGFIAWDFGEVYLDLTSNREEPAEEQNADRQCPKRGSAVRGSGRQSMGTPAPTLSESPR